MVRVSNDSSWSTYDPKKGRDLDFDLIRVGSKNMN